MSVPVLFFSRGRGYGHAIPDMAIGKELAHIAPSISVQYVSYATGAEVFKSAGINLIDLELPEANAFISTLKASYRVIKEQKPRVIISHEEFASLAAANLLGIPTIFISAWLPQSGSVSADALSCADSIIMLNMPGIFPIPNGVKVKPLYTGPILRDLKFTLNDRWALREEINISKNCFCVVVVPGGASSELQTPIYDVVVAAFEQLKSSDKKLIWVSSKDFAFLNSKSNRGNNIEIIKFSDPIERLLAVADIVITKGTRGITLDASVMGIPSISLSFGQNPIDELLVPRIRSNISLNAKAVDDKILLHYIEAWSRSSNELSPMYKGSPSALEKTVQYLAREISRLE